MIHTITLWADNLNPYKPNIVVSKILVDSDDVRLVDSTTIHIDKSVLTFPNNIVTVEQES